MAHERGSQSEVCHRQRENETQSPHPRSLASGPEQTNQTPRWVPVPLANVRGTVAGPGALGGDSAEKPREAGAPGEQGKEGVSCKGKNTLSPVLFSLSSGHSVEPGHVTPRSHSRGLLAGSSVPAWNKSQLPRGHCHLDRPPSADPHDAEVGQGPQSRTMETSSRDTPCSLFGRKPAFPGWIRGPEAHGGRQERQEREGRATATVFPERVLGALCWVGATEDDLPGAETPVLFP